MVLIISLQVLMGNTPVFFTQMRPGYKEKIFKLIKFRSMNNKRDAQGNLLPDELRLTKWGLFLRKSSLDEIPQLLNVLKGDMSLVGPRPLLVEYLSLYNEEQKQRHLVRPGITGWAQINGRNNISWKEKLALDVYYVENRNFKLDILILLKTAQKVFKGSNTSKAGFATTDKFTGNN